MMLKATVLFFMLCVCVCVWILNAISLFKGKMQSPWFELVYGVPHHPNSGIVPINHLTIFCYLLVKVIWNNSLIKLPYSMFLHWNMMKRKIPVSEIRGDLSRFTRFSKINLGRLFSPFKGPRSYCSHGVVFVSPWYSCYNLLFYPYPQALTHSTLYLSVLICLSEAL